MLIDSPTKSISVIKIFLAISLLAACALPTNSFAKDDSKSSSPSTKELVPEKDTVSETEKTEPTWDEVEESQTKDVTENQTVKAENYNQAWDDAMVAAPAFGD